MAKCVCCSGAFTVPSPFDQAVKKVSADLNEEFGDALQGIFLAGSVATGHINVMSDLDLFVIHKEMKRQRRLFRFPVVRSAELLAMNHVKTTSSSYRRHSFPSDYINVEVFINPTIRMINEIQSLEDPTVNAWRQGHILQDDDEGTLLSIKILAIETHKQRKPGCEEWSDLKISTTRYELLDQLHDAWDAIEAGDAASGALIITGGLSLALDCLYSSRGWWSVKEKKRLRDLAERSTMAKDETARRVLPLAKRIARGDLELVERHASLKELFDIVLEPLGGPLAEWTTAWEGVDETTGSIV
ncbi:hypothetical protein HDU67_010120 [Dinochytrium kinnereticum]|nr:hypothetical protein HDU67_010120 [Dinochytrium kinnereticum]